MHSRQAWPNSLHVLRHLSLGIALLAAFASCRAQQPGAATPGVELAVMRTVDEADGTFTRRPMVVGPDGLLYGAAEGGGAHAMGTVFRLSADGQFEVVHDFSGPDGRRPQGLTVGPDGGLYGVASEGGEFGDGTAFRIDPTGKFTPLHSFLATSSGAVPVSTLLLASDGLFYGITFTGGKHQAGTVYRMKPNGRVETLHHFRPGGADGHRPEGRLVEGPDGLIYGTTLYGGKHRFGTVYKMHRNGRLRVLLSFFHDARYGTKPANGLTVGPGGRLYGVIRGERFQHRRGLIYRIDGHGHFEIVHDFETQVDIDGKWPHCELLLGRDGALYGTTTRGGSGSGAGGGTVFRLTADGELTTLHSFSYHDDQGARPWAGLVELADGEFFGATDSAGGLNRGTLYRLRVPR